MSVDAVACFAIDEMRDLRRWHWRKVSHYRAMAKRTRKASGPDSTSAVSFDQQANFHIKIVQLLNQFFNPYDDPVL